MRALSCRRSAGPREASWLAATSSQSHSGLPAARRAVWRSAAASSRRSSAATSKILVPPAPSLEEMAARAGAASAVRDAAGSATASAMTTSARGEPCTMREVPPARLAATSAALPRPPPRPRPPAPRPDRPPAPAPLPMRDRYCEPSSLIRKSEILTMSEPSSAGISSGILSSPGHGDLAQMAWMSSFSTPERVARRKTGPIEDLACLSRWAMPLGPSTR